MKVVQVKPTLLSRYISELKQAGYLGKVRLSAGWEAKIKKILKELRERYGEEALARLLPLLVKYFEDVKEEFSHIKFAHYPYPHPLLLHNDEVIEFLKSFSKVKKKINLDLREAFIRALSTDNDRELENLIKEVAYGGRSYEEIRNAFISACKYLSISPKSRIARAGIEWINLYTRR